MGISIISRSASTQALISYKVARITFRALPSLITLIASSITCLASMSNQIFPEANRAEIYTIRSLKKVNYCIKSSASWTICWSFIWTFCTGIMAGKAFFWSSHESPVCARSYTLPCYVIPVIGCLTEKTIYIRRVIAGQTAWVAIITSFSTVIIKFLIWTHS